MERMFNWLIPLNSRTETEFGRGDRISFDKAHRKLTVGPRFAPPSSLREIVSRCAIWNPQYSGAFF